MTSDQAREVARFTTQLAACLPSGGEMVPYRMANNVASLIELARRLHRLFERDCNGMVSEPVYDRRYRQMTTEAKEIAGQYGLFLYVQTDPRGMPLYLCSSEEDATDARHNKGFVVPFN